MGSLQQVHLPVAPVAIAEGLTPRGLNLEGVGRRRNWSNSGDYRCLLGQLGMLLMRLLLH